MDRSFLSRPAVVTASRDFVCVRLATYEDPAEATFVKGLVRTGSGELENTAVCLLAPDGKTKLSRPGRAFSRIYADPGEMAAAMKKVAETYQPEATPSTLPLVANPRLALDVASADGLPLVVIVGKDAATRQRLVDRVARLAWTGEFIGRFVYAEGTAKEVIGVSGITVDAGVIVIAPDRFGQTGTVIRQVGAGDAADQVADALRASAGEYRAPAKEFDTHVRDGHRLGIFWETRVPVTDPMENAARERGRRVAQPPPKE